MLHPLARSLTGVLALLPLTALAADPTTASVPPAASADIRTPPAPAEPRINGPRVYGARPGHPFFYHLPVTGERPVKFSAQGLPPDLALDPSTGNITGVVTERGTYPVAFNAVNGRGTDKATINFVIGDNICLTPPLGWNSWNHFQGRVSDEVVRASADAMVSSGLIDHGWTYVNIDDCWQGKRDADGNIQGNEKFRDLKALGDYIHGKGLKFGIYSSPGPQTCAHFAGSYQHEDQDARSYAGWGVDYVKYDLCSYGSIIRTHLRDRKAALLPADQQAGYLALEKQVEELQRNRKRTPEEEAHLKEVNAQLNTITQSLDAVKLKAIELEEQQIPYRVFGESLAKVPRDIVYSFCQYGNANSWEWAASLGGNCWRTTGDIQANWRSMRGIWARQNPLAQYAGPGHWNDPDMLEVGNAGLNADECYTHMTAWSLLAAPLLIGCDMSKMDPLTVSMFSNDEVLAVNQDALGKQGYQLKANDTSEVWVKPLTDGALAVGLFNTGEAAADVGVTWAELNRALTGVDATAQVRDLWRQKAVSGDANGLKMPIAAHGAELVRVSAAR